MEFGLFARTNSLYCFMRTRGNLMNIIIWKGNKPHNNLLSTTKVTPPPATCRFYTTLNVYRRMIVIQIGSWAVCLSAFTIARMQQTNWCDDNLTVIDCFFLWRAMLVGKMRIPTHYGWKQLKLIIYYRSKKMCKILK